MHPTPSPNCSTDILSFPTTTSPFSKSIMPSKYTRKTPAPGPASPRTLQSNNQEAFLEPQTLAQYPGQKIFVNQIAPSGSIQERALLTVLKTR